MLKREVETGGEYAWRDPDSFRRDEYRKVTLLEFLGTDHEITHLVNDGNTGTAIYDGDLEIAFVFDGTNVLRVFNPNIVL